MEILRKPGWCTPLLPDLRSSGLTPSVSAQFRCLRYACSSTTVYPSPNRISYSVLSGFRGRSILAASRPAAFNFSGRRRASCSENIVNKAPYGAHGRPSLEVDLWDKSIKNADESAWDPSPEKYDYPW